MRRIVTIALAAAALIAPAGVVESQSVDEIVARHIEARGGYDRLKSIQTIRITRTIAATFSNIRVVIYKKRPQLYRAEQGPAEPGARLTPRGVNAETAWDTVQGGKIVSRPEPLATETRELDADFDGLLVDWKQKGHAVNYEGREPVAGREAIKLKVVTKGGSTRIVYLDPATYLDRRHVGVLNLPGGRQFDVSIDFSNWREVEGVKFPFDINEDRTGKEPAQSFVTYTEKIEVNVPLEDALFAAPAGSGAGR